MALPDRLEAVVSITEIQQLKARYAEFADAKYGPGRHPADATELRAAAEGQASCFTEDARWCGGDRFGGDIVGREALVEFFSDPPWWWATHYYASPKIEVVHDEAHANWRLWQIGIPAQGEAPVLLSADTSERYRKHDNRWLHSSVQFTRIDWITALPGVLSLDTML